MTEAELVSRAEIPAGAERLGVAGQVVCLHAALRSFPRLEDGPATLVGGLMETGATVLVACMANDRFAIPAPPYDRAERNAIDYADQQHGAAETAWHGMSDIYDDTRTEVDAGLGATSAYVAARPDRVRTRQSPNFAAVGPLAFSLIAAETPQDVFGPLRALVESSGWVLLVGVSLMSMTLLHLAEVVAGRQPFIFWMRGPDGAPLRVCGGGCSMGFDRLEPVLEPLERRTTVGQSLWRAFPAAETVEVAAKAIRSDPQITHCDNPTCVACADAIAGGPLDPPAG